MNHLWAVQMQLPNSKNWFFVSCYPRGSQDFFYIVSINRDMARQKARYFRKSPPGLNGCKYRVVKYVPA